MSLTDKQIVVLYQIVDTHLEWFNLYSDNPPKYEEILKLNHQKIMDIIDCCDVCDDSEMIDELLQVVLEQYIEMVKDYTPGHIY